MAKSTLLDHSQLDNDSLRLAIYNLRQHDTAARYLDDLLDRVRHQQPHDSQAAQYKVPLGFGLLWMGIGCLSTLLWMGIIWALWTIL